MASTRILRPRPWRVALCATLLLASAAMAQTPLPLTVLSADANPIVLSTTRDVLSHRLLVQIDKPAPGAALQVEAGRLRGPDGTAAELKLPDSPSRTFADAGVDGRVVELELQASLPRAIEYSAYLTFRHGAQAPVTRLLKVTRSVPKLPLAVSGTARVLSDPTGWRQATVGYLLQGPLDAEAQATVAVVDLALQVTGQSPVQAMAQVTPASGSASSVRLAAGVPQRMSMQLDRFGAVGEHKGRLLLSHTGFEPVSWDFTVVVRDPWWLAAMLILLGAAASMALRRWIGTARPRLLLRTQAARLVQQIEALRNADTVPLPAEAAVLDDWLAQVTQRVQRLTTAQAVSDADLQALHKEVAQIEDKVLLFADWSAARRQIATLPQQDAAALVEAIEKIGKAMPGVAAMPDEQRQALAQLPMQIDALRTRLLLDRIEALGRQCLQLRNAAVAGSPLLALWTELAAAAEAAATQARAGGHAAARALYEQTRARYAAGVVDDLQARLALAPPPGLPDWPRLKGEVGALLQRARQTLPGDPDTALRTHAEAYGQYLDELIAPLSGETVSPTGLEAVLNNVREERRPTLRSRAGEVAKRLEEATASRRAGDMVAAWASYRQAYNDWAAAKEEARDAPAGHRMGERSAHEQAWVAGVLSPAPLAAATSRPRWPAMPPRDDANALTAQRKRMDFWVDAVALGAAMLLGVNVVWHANPVWGGPLDWALALLWGLGLHQVTGYSFDGVLGLRDKLAK